ncbi:hypothetical protein [Nannocystis pusilla]|uniref:hypothetical protein n=1 Tax=Nannocystis pusilla TaxID=889268 RepID=UPI003B7A0FDA
MTGVPAALGRVGGVLVGVAVTVGGTGRGAVITVGAGATANHPLGTASSATSTTLAEFSQVSRQVAWSVALNLTGPLRHVSRHMAKS